MATPIEVTNPNPEATEPPDRRTRTPRPLRSLLPLTLALLLAASFLAVARTTRPTPYGDHLTRHARVEHETEPRLRTTRTTVEAYDVETGRPRWRYAREGRRPLAVLPAQGDAIALWDDGLVTATDGVTVRWHRALPGSADWLAAHGATGVLRVLGARMLAVVTPRRIAAYRAADGDLRWVLPARRGCVFAPTRAARAHGTLLIAQPCAATRSWTGEIIAVDDLGRITPRRRPLRNERHTAEPPRTEKVVARPR